MSSDYFTILGESFSEMPLRQLPRMCASVQTVLKYYGLSRDLPDEEYEKLISDYPIMEELLDALEDLLTEVDGREEVED